MPAEEIAKVLRDIKLGRVYQPYTTNSLMTEVHHAEVVRIAADVIDLGVVVDATAVYERFTHEDKLVAVYDDHICAPPWDAATICYVNEWGNVHINVLTSLDPPFDVTWQPDDLDHLIDWGRVRWCLMISLYMGGRAGGGIPVPVQGPLWMWRVAVYEDGTPADIRWFEVCKLPANLDFDNDMLVILQTLNLANCTNVQIVEPERPRPERKRLARIDPGLRVSEIHIRPISKSYRGLGTPLSQVPVAAHSVRGHFSRYGPKYGRGLLFGKYEGRFWVPQHLRGSAEAGEVEQTYIVEG